MKNKLMIAMALVVLFGAIGVSGSVFAQSPTPGQGYGVVAQTGPADGTGIYHDELMAIFSEQLGLTVEELEARIEGGETLVQIALAEGMTFEEIKALMPMGNSGNGRMGGGTGYNTCLSDGITDPQRLGQSRGSRNGRSSN
ncbi:MAG: hypothetical protein CVU39_22240 [Chloroflexi bacterium HGW-Chloroflexi-10]|nr:MAG: hypothetical protein CVU39_22240 [Chloroflexi bacterium HGW-Chloroflexi-10]